MAYCFPGVSWSLHLFAFENLYSLISSEWICGTFWRQFVMLTSCWTIWMEICTAIIYPHSALRQWNSIELLLNVNCLDGQVVFLCSMLDIMIPGHQDISIECDSPYQKYILVFDKKREKKKNKLNVKHSNQYASTEIYLKFSSVCCTKQ